MVAGLVARTHVTSKLVVHLKFLGVGLVLDWVLDPRPASSVGRIMSAP